MTAVLKIYAGNNRGLWVRSDKHREMLEVAMSVWPDDRRAVAATMPIRVCQTDEGWSFLGRLAILTIDFETHLLIAERLIEESPLSQDDDDLPDWPSDIDTYRPHTVALPVFRSETESDGDGGGTAFEICPDGKRVGTGS